MTDKRMEAQQAIDALLNIVKPVETVGHLFIEEHVGGFAQLTQAQTQGRGRADGVTVRTAMAQDGVSVTTQQKLRSLIPRQRLHRA